MATGQRSSVGYRGPAKGDRNATCPPPKPGTIGEVFNRAQHRYARLQWIFHHCTDVEAMQQPMTVLGEGMERLSSSAANPGDLQGYEDLIQIADSTLAEMAYKAVRDAWDLLDAKLSNAKEKNLLTDAQVGEFTRQMDQIEAHRDALADEVQREKRIAAATTALDLARDMYRVIDQAERLLAAG